MSTAPSHSLGQSTPVWEIATLFPDQGEWDEADYLALETNHLVEFTDGHVEVLPMPKTSHQRLVAYLYGLLLSFSSPKRLGTVLFAPLRIRLRPRLIREPDIVFMLTQNTARIGEDYWDRADLVMEVVSGAVSDRERDLVRKRNEYAEAGIPEYWMIDPQEQCVTVLVLDGDRYTAQGEFSAGDRAASILLEGFEVEVTALFASAM